MRCNGLGAFLTCVFAERISLAAAVACRCGVGCGGRSLASVSDDGAGTVGDFIGERVSIFLSEFRMVGFLPLPCLRLRAHMWSVNGWRGHGFSASQIMLSVQRDTNSDAQTHALRNQSKQVVRRCPAGSVDVSLPAKLAYLKLGDASSMALGASSARHDSVAEDALLLSGTGSPPPLAIVPASGPGPTLP